MSPKGLDIAQLFDDPNHNQSFNSNLAHRLAPTQPMATNGNRVCSWWLRSLILCGFVINYVFYFKWVNNGSQL